jgi:hypothetical protein
MTHGSARALLGREAGSDAMGHVVMSEPSLSREVGSGAAGHATVCGCMPYPLSWLEACTRGYPVCRVSTMAPWAYLGRGCEPQVEPTSLSPRGFSEIPS